MEVVGLLFFIGVFMVLGSAGISLLLVILSIVAIAMHLGITRNKIAYIMTAVSVYLIYTAIM